MIATLRKGLASLMLLAVLLVGVVSIAPSESQAVTCGAGSVIGSGCVVFLTSGTSWSVPSDWNSANNSIEVIGGGGGATYAACYGTGYGGGGGGAYSKVLNVTLTGGGSVAYAVGSGGSGGGACSHAGSGGDTYFCNSTSNCASIGGSAVVVGAKGGTGGTGAGGQAASGVGTTKYSGGHGGGGVYPTYNSGGGGAAGPFGPGANGVGEGSTNLVGGGAGNGKGGAGGAQSTAGTAGTEWDATHGSGGGGGGKYNSAGAGGAGGLYGGGGGNGYYNSGNGAGAQGIVVITYTPSGSGAGGLTLGNNTTVTGNASILGHLSKGSGSFVIDHPLNPKNWLLYHSFVESPDMMNLYDGIATLDENGEATVTLPSYFLALNKDFQYLTTPVGESMPDLHISKEVRRSFFNLFGTPIFRIAGGMPGGRVSWQVTGVRNDVYAQDHRIVPEVEKGTDQPVEKGEYLCEECYAK